MLEPAFAHLLEQALNAAAQYDPSAIEPLEEALRQFVLPHGTEQVRAAVAALQQMEFEEACGHLEKARQHA